MKGEFDLSINEHVGHKATHILIKGEGTAQEGYLLIGGAMKWVQINIYY